MPTGSPTDPSALPLIGRRRELDALAAAHQTAIAGRACVVLVAGETGVGKSRLIQEFITLLGSHGTLVVKGMTPVIVGGEIPFAPVAGALRGLAQQIPSKRLAELIPSDSELARLLPDHATTDASGADPLAQVRLFEQWLSLIVRLGSENDGGVVLILEDLHWTDASTRDLLAHLITNLSTGRVLLVLTVRSEGLAGNEPLRRLLLEATRQPSVQSIDIDPLSRDETDALVAAMGGADVTTEMRMRIANSAGGNPLFAEQLVRTGSGETLPHTLVGLVRQRLDLLSPEARRIAQLASAGVSGLPVALLEAAAALLQLSATPALAELREAGIVEVAKDQSDLTCMFRHPLVQEVVYGDLMPAERQRLHRAFGDAMAPRTDGTADRKWALELARHLWMAGDVARAVPALVKAADSAMDSLAFTEALVLYERAIELGASYQPSNPRGPIGFRTGGAPQPRDDHQSNLRDRAAEAASLAGYPERALEMLEAEHLPQHDDVTVSMRRAQYLWQAGREDEALEVYRSRLGSLPDDHPEQRAAFQGAAARAMLLAGLADEAQHLAATAAEAAHASGAESEELHALYTLSAAQARLGDPTAAVGTLEQAREIDLRRQRRTRIEPRPSRIIDLLSGYWSEATVLNSAGRRDEAAAAALEGARVAAKLGIRGGWGGMVGVAAANELIALGRWSEAQSLLEEWLNATSMPTDASHSHAAYAFLLALRGHAAEAAAQLARSRKPGAPSDTQLRAAQLRAETEIGLATGQPSETRRALDVGLHDLGDRFDSYQHVELAAMSLRAAADEAGQARARRATAELAAIQSDALVLQGRALASGTGTGTAKSGRLDALVAWATAEYGRVMDSRDPAPWLAAAEQWAALREPHRVAYMHLRAAAELLARSGPKKDAGDLLLRAHATCLDLGAEPLRREIESLARRARIDLAQSADSTTEIAAPSDEGSLGTRLGLSPREVEVLELLADGRTNRQIGEALFITEKTAGHHVSSILGKLGVASRVEAASVAARAGLGNPSATGVPVGELSVAGRNEDLGGAPAATLMFTDIVSSTALLETIGDDAWLALIAWHDEAVRSLVRAYAGREIDHAGDGFFLAFPDVIAALDCAVNIQRALAEHRRKHGFAPRLRIAVHRAKVLADGTALRGKGVHEAARIAEATQGDEIVVSSDSLESVGRRYSRGQPRTVVGAGLGQTLSVVPIEWRQAVPIADVH